MRNKKSNYDKILLAMSAVLALGAAGFLIWQSQGFPSTLAPVPARAKNDPGTPPTEQVKSAMQRLGQKIVWVAPVIDSKAIPLNKSVLLIQKGDQLFDLQAPEPVLRPPLPNEYLVKNDLPNIESPNVADLDPDGDGFSTLEEFNKKTNPRDPASHPPVTDKLFLKQRITHDYILKLNSSSAPFQVQRIKPEPKASKFVSPGDEFGFERGVVRFKVLGFEQKTVKDDRLGEKDASELKMLDTATNKEFTLVRGTEFNLAEYEAEFEFALTGTIERRTVKEGETFQIPGLGVTFKVLSIEESKALIAPLNADGSLAPSLEINRR